MDGGRVSWTVLSIYRWMQALTRDGSEDAVHGGVRPTLCYPAF